MALMIYLRDYVSFGKTKLSFGMVGGAMLLSVCASFFVGWRAVEFCSQMGHVPSTITDRKHLCYAILFVPCFSALGEYLKFLQLAKRPKGGHFCVSWWKKLMADVATLFGHRSTFNALQSRGTRTPHTTTCL